MNALDMWLASTLDLPWTPATSAQATTTTTTSDEADPALDIELLSELISAQDASAAIPPAQSTLWPEVTAVLRPSAPAPEHSQLGNVGFFKAESWLNGAESAKESPLFDSLADLSAIGSLTISGVTETSPNVSPVTLEATSVPDVGTNTTAGPAGKRTVSEMEDSYPDSEASSSPPATPTGTEADVEDSQPQKKRKKTTRRQPPKDSPAYRRRRDQNNQAVRRCRQKTKERNDENQRVADGLREENSLLRERLNSLFREVRSLRAMLGLRQPVDEIDVLSGSLPTASSAPGSTCAGEAGTASLWQGLSAGLIL